MTAAMVSACLRAIGCLSTGEPQQHEPHVRFYSAPRWLYCTGTYDAELEGTATDIDLDGVLVWHRCSAYPTGHAVPLLGEDGAARCDLTGTTPTASKETTRT